MGGRILTQVSNRMLRPFSDAPSRLGRLNFKLTLLPTTLVGDEALEEIRNRWGLSLITRKVHGDLHPVQATTSSMDRPTVEMDNGIAGHHVDTKVFRLVGPYKERVKEVFVLLFCGPVTVISDGNANNIAPTVILSRRDSDDQFITGRKVSQLLCE